MVWLKIEEVAKRSGLTKRTIRYYEELGILPPPERSEGKIRLYTEEHIETLKKVIDAKEVLGFSLQELLQYISFQDALAIQRQEYKRQYKDSTDQAERKKRLLEIDKNTSDLLDLIQQKLQKIHEVQSELENMQSRVRDAISNINDEITPKE
jgi:DNA-binding transcriptional MerR regulator